MTVNVVVNHNTVPFDLPYLPVPIMINTSVRNIVFTATKANGTQLQTVYNPQQVGQSEFPVPFNGNGDSDTHPESECLDNFGDIALPPSTPDEIRANLPGEPGDTGDWQDFSGWDAWEYYEHWHDEEEAYGGRVPHLQCGIVTAPGAQPTSGCEYTWF